MTEEIDPRDIRVSDAEREHIGGLLQRAVGQGRISVSEFDERMKVAMAARTRGELNSVVIDIAEAHPARSSAAAAKKDLLLKSGMGNITRSGYWVVPENLTVEGGLGDTTLDFSEAEFTARTTTIQVRLGMGNLKIIVPRGAIVDLDEMRASMGSIKDKTERSPGDSGPHIVVRGRSSLGDVVVRHPKKPFWSHRRPAS